MRVLVAMAAIIAVMFIAVTAFLMTTDEPKSLSEPEPELIRFGFYPFLIMAEMGFITHPTPHGLELFQKNITPDGRMLRHGYYTSQNHALVMAWAIKISQLY